MTSLQALGSGLAGALVLTAVHETARRGISKAPRMDTLGSRAIAQTMESLGQEPPSEPRLHETALIGDVVSNAMFYSLIGLGDPEGAPQRGALLGLAAGIGGVVLPGPMGLGRAPSSRTKATQAMTVGWYTLGGLAAGVAYRMIAEQRD